MYIKVYSVHLIVQYKELQIKHENKNLSYNEESLNLLRYGLKYLENFM